MRESPAREMGLRHRAISKALIHSGTSEEEFCSILYGDLRELVRDIISDSIDTETYASAGKRAVQIKQARFAMDYFASNDPPEGMAALVLPGKCPELAFKPWAKTGIAQHFVGYEIDSQRFSQLRALCSNKRSLQKKVGNHLTPLWTQKGYQNRITYTIIHDDILKDQEDYIYSVIDLDFCRSHIRTEEDKRKVLQLLIRQAPEKGPFVVRMTIHVGHPKNTKEDIRRHIRTFQEDLRNHGGFEILASTRDPYHCMMSLTWILERLN